jgi:hypothetical protein
MATRAAWIERVRRYEQSGLDLADFARAEGLELLQLEWWCRVLREWEPQRAAGADKFLPPSAGPIVLPLCV